MRNQSVKIQRMFAIVTVVLAALTAQAAKNPRAADEARTLVTRVVRADYQGNREELRKLYDELSPYIDDKQIGSRVSYWRGFALWRRAFNGFNENADPKDLESDMLDAIREFEASAAKDQSFTDPKVANASCVMTLMYLHQQDEAKVKEHLQRLSELMKELKVSAVDNPRYYWVLGTGLWYRPEQSGGGQGAAMATYGKGLEIVHHQKVESTDVLDPSWGEPELLMNLAWSNLHRSKPDLNAAENYAKSALTLVPDWHYVRDILLPQIKEAAHKQN